MCCEEVVEEDIPVLAFDRADEFSNQRLPTLPFACQICDSSSAKAWTTALKKLNHAEINDLRGEIGNAIDWNKLNDTFLVDFKGSMFWLPRNSNEHSLINPFVTRIQIVFRNVEKR